MTDRILTEFFQDVKALIYQDGQIVAGAILILPLMGLGSGHLKGVGCWSGDKDKPYEVKFRPLHLWAIEDK